MEIFQQHPVISMASNFIGQFTVCLTLYIKVRLPNTVNVMVANDLTPALISSFSI